MKPRHTKYRHRDGIDLSDHLRWLADRFPEAKAWLDAHGPVTFIGAGAARRVFRLRGGRTMVKLDTSDDAHYNLREYAAYKRKLLPMAACRPILNGRILLMRAVRFPGKVELPPAHQTYYVPRVGREPIHPPLVYQGTRFADWAAKITDWAQGGYTRTTRKLVCYDVSHEFWIKP